MQRPDIPPSIDAPPVPAAPAFPAPKEIDVIRERNDLAESLRALVAKYSIGQFTIATSDGLVFASSGGDSAQTDAARYGEQYTNDPLTETPGIFLFGFSHKGSDLVGIVRADLEVPEETGRRIERDTKDILNRWI